MISKEDINDFVTGLFLSDIIDFIPMNSKVKRKAIEGVIKKGLPERERIRLSLNECLNFGENNRVLERFINILETKFSHCDLSSFYHNIKTLRIVEKKKSLVERLSEILSIKSSGKYLTSRNVIKVYSGSSSERDEIKTHELLHMATARKGKNVDLCGFEKTANGIVFGRGLNEGYTEWLNCRKFGSKGESYAELQPIVSRIERLVGAEEMEKFYFSNDLNGLIQAMEKYTSREDALNLIQKMDQIFSLYGKVGISKLQERLCREARVDVANMLVKKYKSEFESGQLSEFSYIEKLFDLELFTHNYSSFFWTSKESKKVEKAAISDCLFFSPIVEMPIKRYAQIVRDYYESKKDNLTYTYDEWSDQNGLGIKNIIIREQNIQTMIQIEEGKGRNPGEVREELETMLREHPEKISTTTTILKPL